MNIEIQEKLKEHFYIWNHLPIPYTTFYLTKGRKQRRIDAPVPELRKIQDWILKKILYPQSHLIHPASIGFMPGHSTSDAAKKHVNSTYILKADIKNFFPSVTINIIRRHLERLEIDARSIFRIALICSHNKCLPQGASTSPFLSNLVLYNADTQIKELASRANLVYTRYADDIILSGNISPRDLKRIHHKELVPILRLNGFKINNYKTKILKPHQQQKILGIVINEKLSLPRALRKKIRAILHRHGASGLKPPLRIKGMLAYIQSVNLEQHTKLWDHYLKHYNNYQSLNK